MMLRHKIRSSRSVWLSLLIVAATISLPPVHAVARQQGNVSAGAQRNAPRTIAELQTRIGEIAHQPALEPGFFAVKIVSLDTGNVIYEQNANKLVRPASNMKLYIVATAFERLTPDFHFSTSVYAKE